MEKIIQLKNDAVFRRARRINLNHDHTRHVTQHAEGAREALCDLVIHGKLDAIDLRIIAARDCSPMPTQSEVGRMIGISQQAVHKRVVRFQRLFIGV